MPAASGPTIPSKVTLYSIQTVYSLYWDTNTARKTRLIDCTLRCRNDIKIPVCESVTRVLGADERCDVIPATALVFENDFVGNTLSRLKILIETNEGVTVEPIIVKEPITIYKVAYLLVLPRGATGVKNVHITIDSTYIDVPNDLRFSVMQSPYNYENYLVSLLYGRVNLDVNQMLNKINNLESRVIALENKAGE